MTHLRTDREQSLTSAPPRSEEATHRPTIAAPTLPPATERDTPAVEPSRARLDRIISSALGVEVVSFLLSKSSIGSPQHLPMCAALEGAAQAVKEEDHRAGILHLLRLYNTAVDFDAKLNKPRSPHHDESGSQSYQTTVPDGESVDLIHATLETITGYFHARSHILTSAREAIELTRLVSDLQEIPVAPTTVRVETPALPLPPQQQGELAEERQKSGGSYLATISLGAAWIGRCISTACALLAVSAARLREIAPTSKANDRSPEDDGLLKRALQSFIEFDIKGLEALAQNALGMLAPRGSPERFAQTGNEREEQVSADGESARRTALFKFVIDLGKIKGYFRKHPQIERCEHRFYCKEPQVLLDREGRFARLDSFLARSPEGRALFDAFYQPIVVGSDTADASEPTVTLPTIPLTPTTLPLPPHHVITGLEYLDAQGRRIDQPEENELRACVAGGALVTPPREARLVRYTHTSIRANTSNTTTAKCAPRPLTAQEFRSFQELLPKVAFDLGEDMETVYTLIREFADPETRVALAAHAESYRGWVYTKDPLLGAVQYAAGDTFLESVYHARAGICDSMSAVASYLVGDAVGLPGLVVSGPVVEGEFFNRTVGHSIAQSLLPDGVMTFDLTEASRSSSRVTGARVPAEARDALASAISAPAITRRELANRYRDLGDLIRGETPKRYIPNAAEIYTPVRLWRDILIDGETSGMSDNPENIPALPNQHKIHTLLWAAQGVQLDHILERCESTQDFDEFGWFLSQRLKNLFFEPPAGPEHMRQAWGTSERFKELAYRDLTEEAARHLFSVVGRGKFSQAIVSQFPAIAKALSIPQAIRFIDTLLHHNYPNELTARLVEGNIDRFIDHLRNLSKGKEDPQRATQLTHTIRGFLAHHTERGALANSESVAQEIPALFHAAKPVHERNSNAPEERGELTAAIIELLRDLWISAGSHGATILRGTLLEDGPAVLGLRFLLAAEPDATRAALRLDTESGREQIVVEVLRALHSPTPSVESALALVTNARALMGTLDLSNAKESVLPATKRIITTFLKQRSESERRDDPVINWPDEKNPASLLSWISLPEKGGGRALSLLTILSECNGLSQSEARALWPSSSEVEVARRFVRECEFEDGGILNVGDEYEWHLTHLSNLLNEIITQSSQPRVAQTCKEILSWTNARGELLSLPDEKHFLSMLRILGGVPGEWSLEDQSSSIAEALIEIAQGSMKSSTLYAALDSIAPYLIAPAEDERAEEHEIWLRNLARTMRECVDDTVATEHLAHTRRWTQKPPRPLTRTIEGCAVACSIADLACQLDLKLSLLTRAVPFTLFTHVDPTVADNGTSPHTQLWDRTFPLEMGYPYYRKPSSHHRVVALREVFTRLSSQSHATLRSPLLNFISAERGKVRVSGFVGTPESARPYRSGDDVRSIDWKRSARTDALMIKVREEREERALTIVMDLGTLGLEIRGLLDERTSRRAGDGSGLRALIQGAPHLATLVHEAMVAYDNNLPVDLVLTHHTVIRHYKDAAKSILGIQEDSVHFWAGVENDAEKARELREDEEEIFGPSLFQTGSPFGHGQIEIPRRHIIHFLMGPEATQTMIQTVPLLRARGNRVFAGPLVSFRGA
jgi:hypothetical protein